MPGANAARAEMTRGNHPAALQLACAAIQRDPQCHDAYVVLGELALAKPQGESVAENLFRQALALRPNDANVQRLLATALVPQGKVDEAVALAARALQAQPRDPATLLLAARIQLASNRLVEAEKILRAAVHFHPAWREANGLLGDLLKRRGDVSGALIRHRRAAGSNEMTLPPVGRPRRAILLVQLGAAWASLASLHRALANDPEWNVTVVGLPFLHSHYSDDSERHAVFGFLTEAGIPFVRWEDFRLEPGCADVAFLHLPYDETLPRGWHHDDLFRAVPRLVYIPYALVVVGGTENTAYQFNLPLQQRAWMVVAHSPRNRAMFTRHCTTGDAHVAITGHPKLDVLQNLDTAPGEALRREAAGRKVVCWNPHFDVRPDGSRFGSGCSTFLGWQSFLLDEIARRPDLFLLIRPHPLFFSTLAKKNLWSPAEAEEFQRRIAALPNVRLDSNAEYLPAFSASAAMISDASSLILEFAATGRPLLYLRNPHGPGLNDHGDLVRDHLYTAENESEIRTFLDQIATGSDPRREGRLAALSEYLVQPEGGAGVAIVRAIDERLAAEVSPVPVS